MPKQDQEDLPRRRGRPTGKNRVPLSAEERRARNAQYERERRNEYADAMLDLAMAAGCENGISNPEILATVINQIQRAATRNPSKDIEELKRINENLESQIASLTKRLENEPESCETPAAKKYKLSENSELRTDAEPQTSNSFYNPVHRAALEPNKRINKLTKGKELKVRQQSTEGGKNNPHNSVIWSEVISRRISNERSESESPEPQSPHTEIWTEDSSNSAPTTDCEQKFSTQQLNDNVLSLNGVKVESDSSDDKLHSTFHTQTEHKVPEEFASDQRNQLEPLPVQRTQYNPPPDLITDGQPQYFQIDQLNIPETQLTPDLEPMTNAFSDSEKCFLHELINCSSDLFRSENYDSSAPLRQWPIEDFLML